MKSTFIHILISFITFSNLQGQCVVEAGLNRNLCPEEIQNSPLLHGNIISGNVVETKWESIYYSPTFGGTYYHASSMLNDTTILEPVIEQHYEKTVTYHLTGYTQNNESCIDSVVLNFSDWTFTLLDKIQGKAPTDTIQLWIAAYSNWPHTQYEWSPNYMISDTTVEKPLVWNDTTVFYNLVITDSLGCSVTDDVFKVYSVTSSVHGGQLNNIKVYPNPTIDYLNIESSIRIKSIEIIDLNGNVIATEKKSEIDLSSFKYGTYLLKMNFIDGNVGYRKIIKSGI